MARIGLEDTVQSALIKMSDGNPGALTVLAAMLRDGKRIDPLGFAGGFGAVLSLDTEGVYGSRIWLLFKDVCGESLVRTLAVLRAVQLGLLTSVDLAAALRWAETRAGARPFNPADLVALVRARLGQGFDEKPAEGRLAVPRITRTEADDDNRDVSGDPAPRAGSGAPRDREGPPRPMGRDQEGGVAMGEKKAETEATCGTCPFWHGNETSTSAVCARSAPRATGKPTPDLGAWPWTQPRDWCGEHPSRQRDRLAAMAMQGLVSTETEDSGWMNAESRLASRSYAIADAMLAARAKGTP